MLPLEVLNILPIILVFTVYQVESKISPEKQILITKYCELYKINTGYTKDKNPKLTFHSSTKTAKINDLIDDQINEIRCGFAMIAQSYMRISKYLFRRRDSDLKSKGSMMSDLNNYIKSFSKHATDMMTILHSLGVVKMFEIWIFYLYTTDFQTIYSYLSRKIKDQDDVKMNLYEIHRSVEHKLKVVTKKCVTNNVFILDDKNRFHSFYKLMSKTGNNVEWPITLINNYRKMINPIMENNMSFEFIKKNSDGFTLERLLLNEIVFDDNIMNDLMFEYDNRIVWGNTLNVLQNASNNFKNSPKKLFNSLSELKTYHALFKDLIKVIMLRITWTHLILINDKSDEYNFKFLNKFAVREENLKLVKILKKFALNFALESDVFINQIISCLIEKSWNCVTLNDMGINMIKEELSLMSVNFQNAKFAERKPIESKNNLKEHFKKCVRISDKIGLRLPYQEGTCEIFNDLQNNYTRAVIFVDHLRHLLKKVDFFVIRSLTSCSYESSIDIDIQKDFKAFQQDIPHNLIPPTQNYEVWEEISDIATPKEFDRNFYDNKETNFGFLEKAAVPKQKYDFNKSPQLIDSFSIIRESENGWEVMTSGRFEDSFRSEDFKTALDDDLYTVISDDISEQQNKNIQKTQKFKSD
ncbi:uncharacterized protein LOC126907824 [Daktulosphaira vitifoliae]|uniref:uncharacterized protein LOC126907824 n=1 Tax=Daktulosphaira vitifoliae TaxID=58002 RepID=UPI0021AAA59C|nr:uncharacterized protein LOC126907824 [Daktulosphaira vitifoliae]